MNNFELILGIGIFVLGLYALIRDYKFFVYLLLLASVFIHKEMFSFYRWDFLPIRFLMLSLSFYAVGKLCLNIYRHFKFDKKHKIKTLGDLDFLNAKQFLKDPFILGITLVWLVRGISVFFSIDIVSSLELFAFFTTIYIAIVFFYTRFKNNSAQILKYLDFYVFLVFLLCIFGFIQLFLDKYYGITVGAFWAVPGHIPRVGSLFWDVNHFGAFISSLFLYGFVRAITVPTIKLKLLYFLLILPVPVVLYLTNSRSSMLLMGTAGAVFGFLFLFKLIGKKAYALSLAVLLIVASIFYIFYSIEGSKVREVIRKNFHYRIDSFDSHFLLLSGASEVFEKNIIIGGGYGAFYENFLLTNISSEYLRRDPAGLLTKVPAHTIWGEVAAETGTLGLITFLFFVLVIFFVPLYNLLKLKSYRHYLLQASFVATLTGYSVAGIFYSYNSEFFWFVIALYATFAINQLVQLKTLQDSQMNLDHAESLNKAQLVKPFSFADLKKVFLHVEDKMSLGFSFIFIFAVFLIFINLGKNALITWDESIYGKIAKNMFLSKDYATLSWFNDKNWFEKPPLYFWTTSFFMKIFGVTEFAVRLTSALSGLGTVILVTFLGKKLYGKFVGYLSGIVLLTTFQFLYYARTGMLDVTLTFFITASLLIFYVRPKNMLTYLLSGFFVGLAVLTKGIVGFLPLPIIFIYSFYDNLLSKNKSSRQEILQVFIKSITSTLWVVLFSALVFLPWHIYMLILYGQSFYDSYIVYHVLQRATQGIEDKNQPFFWYFVVLRVSMRLWFIALLGALPLAGIVLFFRKKLEKFNIYFTNFEYKSLVFLIIWFTFIFLFFSVSVSKLIWYIIPVYPVVSIIVAFGIVVALRSFFVRLSKSNADYLVTTALYLILVVTSVYFYIQRDRVYSNSYNNDQAQILKQANAKYPDTQIAINYLERPVVLFYRDGPFSESRFKAIKADVLGAKPGQTIVFITSLERFTELDAQFPETASTDVFGKYVLGFYTKP